jgi:hypothetical protein
MKSYQPILKDMLGLLSRSCWFMNNLKRWDLRLRFHWSRGYRWDEIRSVWDEPLLKHGPEIACPASHPPSIGLIDLATALKTLRPDLEEYSVSVNCFIESQSYQKSLGPAQWQLKYPAGSSTRHPFQGEPERLDETLASVVSLPIEEGRTATLIGFDGHQHCACCSAIRAQEDDSVGESAWKARMDGRDIANPDAAISDVDDLGTDSEDSEDSEEY